MWPVNQEIPNTTMLGYNYTLKERPYDICIVIWVLGRTLHRQFWKEPLDD